MKVLITGGSSLLGKYLTKTKPDNIKLESAWYTNFIEGVTSHHLNIVNSEQIGYIFGIIKPDIVIHCAAIGNVDRAEDEYRHVNRVNVFGTENVIRAARKHNAKVIHISSNAVFSGNEPPYYEDSLCNPINAYGKIKRKAERLIIDYPSLDWLIVRPFMLYGWPHPGGRPNWGATIINKLEVKESIKLVNDRIWMPTYAEDCAKAIWQLIKIGKNKQIYHVASSERATLHTFGLKIAKVYGFDIGLIEGVSSSYFSAIAKRPHETTYNLDKIAELGIELGSIENGIRRMKDGHEIFNDKKADMGW